MKRLSVFFMMFLMTAIVQAQSVYQTLPAFDMRCVDNGKYLVPFSPLGNIQLQPDNNYCGFTVYVPQNAYDAIRVDFVAILRVGRPCGTFGNPRYCPAEQRIDQAIPVQNGVARGAFEAYAYQPNFLSRLGDILSRQQTRDTAAKAAFAALMGVSVPYTIVAGIGVSLLDLFKSQAVLYQIDTYVRVCSLNECTQLVYKRIDVNVPESVLRRIY